MPRYDDRYGGTRLYVGRLSSRTRSRDLDDLFSRYGRYQRLDFLLLSYELFAFARRKPTFIDLVCN